MKLKAILSIAAVLLIAGLIYGCLQMRKGRGKEAKGEKPVESKSSVEPGANGEAVVSLDEKTQRLIGLETRVLLLTNLAPEVKCYGRVLDSSSLIGLLSNAAAGRAALEASRKDYERVKALFDRGENASARSLEAADAAMKRDQIALRAAEAQITAAWGRAIADQPDLAAFVQSLTALQLVLIRLDLPAGEVRAVMPVGGRLTLPGTGQAVTAQFLGSARTTDPQIQGQGFVLVFTNTPARLAPGLGDYGFFAMDGRTPCGRRCAGGGGCGRTAERIWVYLQSGPTHFTRREINEEHPVEAGWFVTSGVRPNDRVVTTGAQTLLSEERKTEIKATD